jgi:hypothetical protein
MNGRSWATSNSNYGSYFRPQKGRPRQQQLKLPPITFSRKVTGPARTYTPWLAHLACKPLYKRFLIICAPRRALIEPPLQPATPARPAPVQCKACGDKAATSVRLKPRQREPTAHGAEDGKGYCTQ